MPFVEAKCPECGGLLEVDSEKKAAVCRYCGEAFIIQDAIANYQVYVNGNGNQKQIDSYLKIAQSALSEKRYEEAVDSFSKVIELDVSCVDAYLGKLMAENASNNMESLFLNTDNLEETSEFKKIMLFANEELKSKIAQYRNKHQNNKSDKKTLLEEKMVGYIKSFKPGFQMDLDKLQRRMDDADNNIKVYSNIIEKNKKKSIFSILTDTADSRQLSFHKAEKQKIDKERRYLMSLDTALNTLFEVSSREYFEKEALNYMTKQIYADAKKLMGYRSEEEKLMRCLKNYCEKEGNKLTIGSYNGEPVKWIVIEVRDGKACLISQKSLFQKEFDESKSKKWTNCSLRKHLNGVFKDDFLPTVDNVILVPDENGDLFSIPDNEYAFFNLSAQYILGNEESEDAYDSFWENGSTPVVKIFSNKYYDNNPHFVKNEIKHNCEVYDRAGVRPRIWINIL